MNKAWERAKAEGLRFFWAHMHVGHTMQCVAKSWEEAGFYVNDNGDPVRDCKGNTVAKFTIEPLNKRNPQHRSQVALWWGP